MRILHVLSQRPSLTGSGVTLDALAREAHRAGHEQRALVAAPAEAPPPVAACVPSDAVDVVTFGARHGVAAPDLPFELPGMSDVMPYPSARFSDLDAAQLEAYERVWRNRLRAALASFRPHVIHVHHAWIVAALATEIDARPPVVVHTHGSCLRQLRSLPRIAARVRPSLAAAEAILALDSCGRRDYAAELGLPPERLTVVGAGYRDDVFSRAPPLVPRSPVVAYAGKLSDAKGLPWLLDAFELVLAKEPAARLEIAGGGAGPEAAVILDRLAQLGAAATYHGRLDPTALASILRRARVFVLPSFHEGLPLVLLEAIASGCRAVATALPGIAETLAPRLGCAIDLVELPELVAPERPGLESGRHFAERLGSAIRRALDSPPVDPCAPPLSSALDDFTWSAVHRRVESVWRRVSP